MSQNPPNLLPDDADNRTMNLNAHFAWALAMWGSADVAREEGNFMLAPIGFYYAAFHAGFSYLNSIKGIPLETLTRMGHGRLATLLDKYVGDDKLVEDLNLLREIRETINYLGHDTPAQKLQIVRGHGFGFQFIDKKVSFAELITMAQKKSRAFIFSILELFTYANMSVVNRVPRRDDEEWVDSYLGDDFLLAIIPREANGPKILMRALSLFGEGD
jgi:hypothetical protein